MKITYYQTKPITLNSEKCPSFDKGYRKSRHQCSLKHPLVNCEGSCEDRRICPKRNRVNCKNGNECVFVLTNSCEFLHKADIANTEEYNPIFQSMMKIVEDKISALNEKETFDKIDNLVKDQIELKIYF